MNRHVSHLPRQKVALIFSNIGLPLPEKGEDPVAPVEKFLLKYPELSLLADLKPSFFAYTGSQFDFWRELSATIVRDHDQYDAWVIVADPRSITYPAVALSFILEGLDKPVIFTSIPSAEQAIPWLKSDPLFSGDPSFGFHANLINAIQFAVSGPAEVAIAFGGKAIRATKVVLTGHVGLKFMESLDDSSVSKVGLDIDPAEEDLDVLKPSALRIVDQFEGDIDMLSVPPIGGSDYFSRRVKPSKLVILDISSVGYLPPLWLEIVRYHPNTIFVLYSRYKRPEVSEQLDNLLLSPAVTPEVAFIKISWLYPRFSQKKDLQRMLDLNIRGELSV